MNTTRPRRISAHYIYYRRSLLRNAIVTWSSDGIIKDISVCDNLDFQDGVEFHNGILLPDMVDAHCHLELSHMQGLLPQGSGFVGFARGIGAERNSIPHEERLAAVAAADQVLWQQGVGLVGDISNGNTSFHIKQHSPVNYTTFIELFGLRSRSVHQLNLVIQQAVDAGLRFSVTPHSTYSLNDAAFRSAVEWGDTAPQMENIPLSVHFMESPAERELFTGCGDLHDWYVQCGTATDFEHYASPACRITACVPAHRDIMLIHNTCVTSEDIDVIQEHFTGRVTWVLCPQSNRFISRLEPPVELLRRKGVRIAVGTDSLASNIALDMIAELRDMSHVPLEEILAWVTVNGAEALGMDNCAQFEVGRRCGAVLLSGIDWNKMSLTEHSRSCRII